MLVIEIKIIINHHHTLYNISQYITLHYNILYTCATECKTEDFI